jgi:bifunctional non-homologous end joining protein LigD
MSLKEYVKKRNFGKTAEPKGDAAPKKDLHRFVIQKHAASRLHYDFRLELGGTLKSWAVPKGVPYKKGERRLAVQVEDHPVSYIDFEGTIPQGQYGGGTVMVWDRGTYETLSDTPAEDLAKGKLHVVLKGKKLRGEWYLVQLHDSDQWLLIKGGENLPAVSAKAEDTSVLSGKSMDALSKGAGRVWQSNRAEPAEPVKSRAKAGTKSRRSAVEKDRASDDGMAPLRLKSVASPKTKSTKAKRTSGAGTKRTPDFIEPMKALLVDSPQGGDWIYEIKFDGFRAMAFRDARGTRLLSRNNKDFASKFPEVLAAVESLDAKDAIIDGEIVALDEKGRSSFQLLQAYDLGQKRPPIIFYAFDLLQLNGETLNDLPLTERKRRLEHLLEGVEGPIRYSTSLGNDPDALLKQARDLGLEGLIGKRPDSTYVAGGRNGDWIKLKLHQEQEFVIGGYTPPGGSRPYFGALLVGVYDGGELKFAGKVGTGFNVKLLQSLHAEFGKIVVDECPFSDLPEKRSGRYGQGVTAAEMRRCHWVKPVMVAQIKFAEWTRDDRLRQPVFLGLREDKAATDVVREKPKS